MADKPNPFFGPMTPERKEELRQKALQRVAEGKLGGPEFGRQGGLAKARKHGRIAKRVAEEAMQEDNANRIIEVFKDAIHPNQPIQVRLKGATAWVELANTQAKMELTEEQQNSNQHSRDELLKILSSKLTSGPAARLVQQHLLEQENIQDADVIDEGEAA